MGKLNAFVGWDSRENDAYLACVSSLTRHSSLQIRLFTLIERHLRAMHLGGKPLYTRKWEVRGGQKVDVQDGKPFSTEFAFTRFLVPELMGFGGWALFCDCDFLWRGDVADLLALADPQYAVMCVKHNHVPKEDVKMDNQSQTRYFRKNWSSLVLWNCGHPSNAILARDVVNTKPGGWLHAFGWLKDEEIGALPEEWNWLEGWSAPEIVPKAVHYTRGGPWFEEYQEVPYAEEWREEIRKSFA